jgi:alcohol dehydrogenase class IV
MSALLPLPRLAFGAGSLASLADELTALAVRRPLLISDRGLLSAGIVTLAINVMPHAATFLDVPANPTTAAVDAAFARYRQGECDGVVALGGGSVIDTAKFVAALAAGGAASASELLGHPERIVPGVAPLIAIPTTLGSGSESSPAAGLHAEAHGRAVGTRSSLLVPRVAICDPDLARSLPPHLIAATGIDALAHCLEGYFAEPAHPIVDALALDGAARAFANVRAATEPPGDAARAELMAAAFAGGAAIHKGLGPAHAVSIICGDQGLHHGLIVAIALPHTVALVAPHAAKKADRLASALGLADGSAIPEALQSLNRALGIPATLREAGYRAASFDELADAMARSHFNRTSPYAPNSNDYLAIVKVLMA